MTQAIIVKRQGAYVVTAAGAEVVASLLAQAQAIFASPALTLVAADLAGANTIGTVATNIANVNAVAGAITNISTVAGALTNIGTVATNITSVNTVAGGIADVGAVAADLNLGPGASFILRAPQAAIDAAASAAAVIRQAPAYANVGGQTDRTAFLTVTASAGMISVGTASNLVDGATANNSTDSLSFVGSFAATGSSIEFDYGPGASKVITEATWKQSGSQTHGTVKWQASLDKVTWVDIGSTFTLGGSTSQVQTSLSTNVLGYRAYRLLWTAGTLNGSPFVQEVEFKIAATDSDAKIPVVAGGGARDVLTKKSATSGDQEWRNLSLLDGFPTTGLQADWEMVTDGGTTVRDRYGNNNITLASGANITAHGGYLSTAAGRVETPSFTSVTTVVALIWVPRQTIVDTARTGFLISMAANGGTGLQESGTSTSHTHYVGGYQGTVHGIPVDTASARHIGISTGYWRLVFFSPSAAQTGTIAFGGRGGSGAGGSTCADFKIMRASVFTGAALSDDDRKAIFRSYRRTALKRGFAITESDAAEIADFVVDNGESNCDGRADIADLSAANQARRLPGTLIMASTSATFARSLQQLQLGLNEQVTAPTVDFGPAFGLALAVENATFTRTRKLIICKTGVGGSRIAPSSVGGTAVSTWSPSETKILGIIWRALEHAYAAQAQALAMGLGPRFAGRMMATGLNDATNTIYASSDVVYQGYLQADYDFWVTWGVAPATGYKAAYSRPHTTDPTNDPTALANIRSGWALFAAAQSGVTSVNTDAYTKEPDNIHWDAAANLLNGASAKTAFAI